ncbi:S-adenosyl-L-methionine-dependent methyltransferase [Terfezia boudieri ATCC MYA-4762]|uniref:S-adenosyl-L-methionine-dependent methyltransferase n=1 Tax=Terfezia boudieri ATCC MYA-4762 TaxID=1051890 RepID=A0A3N4LWX6_9PEZI|nr:S-adenosyl-L-methionine-dependent methyltransferase [Terfezia boudieri ATCC MYA-4762]
MPLDLIPRLKSYLSPLYLLAVGLACTIVTAIEIVFFECRPKDILSISKWQDRAFSRTWAIIGPAMVNNAEPEIKTTVSQAFGTVVDVGPGEGFTLKYFDTTRITKVYGIEPNTDMHPVLREEIKRCQLSDIYTIVPSGVERFPNGEIPPGSVDSIVCIRTLCSVPNPRQTIKKLYDLLRPGGELLVFEHCAVPDYKVTSTERILQGIYNIPWPVLLGGCELNRKTDEWLKQAGEWRSIELGVSNRATGYEVMPHFLGRLVKAG